MSEEEEEELSEDENFVIEYFRILKICIRYGGIISISKIELITKQINQILDLNIQEYGAYKTPLSFSFNSNELYRTLLKETYPLIIRIFIINYFAIIQGCKRSLVYSIYEFKIDPITRQIETILGLEIPLNEIINDYIKQERTIIIDESTIIGKKSTLYDAFTSSNEKFKTLLIDSYPIILNEYKTINYYNTYKSKLIILNPSPKYVPIATFNFGSVREDNSFNRNFVEMEEMEETDKSMLLVLNMHGSFVPNSQPHTIDGLILNKFSVSAPGQCSVGHIHQQMYAFYSICYAVETRAIIDVPAILKEGNAHSTISLNLINDQNFMIDPSQIFTSTHSNKVSMYNYEIKNRPTTTNVHHTGKGVGETNTIGDSFFIKSYSCSDYEEKIPLGIYLCKDWTAIGGVKMDNLLINEIFIQFMRSRYPTQLGRIIENERGHKQLYKQTVSNHPFQDDIVGGGIKRLTSLDLFEFCKFYGRPHISLVDDSCSVFPSNEDSVARYDELTNSINAKHAKGTRKDNRNKKHKKRNIQKKKHPKKETQKKTIKRKTQKYRRYI